MQRSIPSVEPRIRQYVILLANGQIIEIAIKDFPANHLERNILLCGYRQLILKLFPIEVAFLEYVTKLLESDWKFSGFWVFAEKESFSFVKVFKFLLGHK
jgi:hypothetical protein